MIEGFKIEVTADEVIRHLDGRIRHHHDLADECDTKARKLEALEPPGEDDEDNGMAMCWPGYHDELQRRATRHRNREVLLMFFRDRIVLGEVYRLSKEDLRSLEWLPMEEGIHAH